MILPLKYGDSKDCLMSATFVFMTLTLQSMSLAIQVCFSTLLLPASAAVLFTPKLGTSLSALSSGYIRHASMICLPLLRHRIPCALALALLNAGSSIAASIAMIAITTSNSIRVNPARKCRRLALLRIPNRSPGDRDPQVMKNR